MSTAQLNIREQEVVTQLSAIPSFRHVMDQLQGEYAGQVRQVLASLATAIDFRRQHPKPEGPPFQGKKPRLELPIFFIGSGFVKTEFVGVGVHETGWVTLITTSVATQMTLFAAERYISIVADWETSAVPWLVEAVDPDRRSAPKLPQAGSASNLELYPFFLDHAYSKT